MNTATHFSQLNIKFLSERSFANDLAQTTIWATMAQNGATFGITLTNKEKYGTTSDAIKTID